MESVCLNLNLIQTSWVCVFALFFIQYILTVYSMQPLFEMVIDFKEYHPMYTVWCTFSLHIFDVEIHIILIDFRNALPPSPHFTISHSMLLLSMQWPTISNHISIQCKYLRREPMNRTWIPRNHNRICAGSLSLSPLWLHLAPRENSLINETMR